MNKSVAILGAGNSGLAMAAHLSLQGLSVRLWNRTAAHIANLIKTKTVYSEGVVAGTAKLAMVSTEMADILAGIETVLITTPASAHAELARQIAPYVKQDMLIVLNPGRTYGALEFARNLQQAGCRQLPEIAEPQTIIYTCRRSGEQSSNILAIKADVLISALRTTDAKEVIARLPECIQPCFIPAQSMIQTSLGNVGMILHCAPVLMNIGWIENKKVQFKYYYDGITPTVATLLEKMDRERINVARALGMGVESVADWLQRTYQITGNTLYECIQNNKAYATIDAPESIHHRYLEEDVPCGLVPTEKTGQLLGVATPTISLIIELASAVKEQNFRQLGRQITPEEINILKRINNEL